MILSSVEAVVTLGKKIQFVSMPDMSPGRSMLIGSNCTGIAVVNNMIYVGDATKMHVLDKIGRQLRTIPSVTTASTEDSRHILRGDPSSMHWATYFPFSLYFKSF
jgi:hypothetical protein